MVRTRHFTFKHPLFGKVGRAKAGGGKTSGVEWRRSIYYLWWEFLRRHDGYVETCKNKGRGKYAKLYADFGDIHAVDFKTWWTKGDRGARLFAEPAALTGVERLEKVDLEYLQTHWDDQTVLVVAIPLSFGKRFIEKRIGMLLKQHHKRKRGQRTIKESRALYPIANQFNEHSLEVALQVYDLKLSNSKLKLWEIAQQLKFTTTLNPDEIGKRGQSGPVAKKAVMSVAASRKLKIAEKLIDGAGKGIFPNFGG